MTTSNSKTKKQPLTLRATIWIYFAVFTVAMLMFLWVFQVLSLDQYYEFSVKRNVTMASSLITQNFDRSNPGAVASLVEDIAYKNKMTIAITDRNGNIITVSDFMGNFSVITSDQGFRLFEYRNRVLMSSTSSIMETVVNERFKTTEILYGALIPQTTYMIFINATFEPIDSTVDIIKDQFVYISALLLFAALWVSLLMSKNLSKPIVQITNSASKMAKGDYAAGFEGGSYAEINELAQTLNYAAQEISKVDTLRNDLIANVSHDLRTPLTMIKAYAEMIRDLSGDKPEKRNEHLGVIIQETDRLSALVSNMLELSKLQSGTMNVEYSKFGLEGFVESVLSRYQHLSEMDGFEFNYESDGDCICYGDRAKLEQVMYNFVNNAINYSGDSRKIIIRTHLLPYTVRIEVVDFGKGIEKDKLPLIFDRYYRGDRTKRDVVGSGLGLSIVKEILRLHKTKYGVQSEIDKGSIFWFEVERVGENGNER